MHFTTINWYPLIHWLSNSSAYNNEHQHYSFVLRSTVISKLKRSGLAINCFSAVIAAVCSKINWSSAAHWSWRSVLFRSALFRACVWLSGLLNDSTLRAPYEHFCSSSAVKPHKTKGMRIKQSPNAQIDRILSNRPAVTRGQREWGRVHWLWTESETILPWWNSKYVSLWAWDVWVVALQT